MILPSQSPLLHLRLRLNPSSLLPLPSRLSPRSLLSLRLPLLRLSLPSLSPLPRLRPSPLRHLRILWPRPLSNLPSLRIQLSQQIQLRHRPQRLLLNPSSLLSQKLLPSLSNRLLRLSSLRLFRLQNSLRSLLLRPLLSSRSL